MIKMKFSIEGIVEKADIIGAIFGQTEGLFGSELNLNELQKNWKISRIEINMQAKNDLVTGEIIIPSSTDIVTTALIAAMIESVEKVGPCDSKIQLVEIQDIREAKRKQIAERAKEILRDWYIRSSSEGEKIQNEIYEVLRPANVLEYGQDKLPAGPTAEKSDDIILVEGRADVINLQRAGYDNTIALNGVKVPNTVVQLKGKKNFVAFLDGDRGGDLIQKELEQMIGKIQIYRAPQGREVEELTPEEIRSILERQPAKPQRIEVQIDEKLLSRIKEEYPSLRDTLESIILDKGLNQIARLPVSELVQNLGKPGEGKHIILDGIATQRLVNAAKDAGYETVVAFKVPENISLPENISVYTFSQLGISS
ncbi:MAG: DNA primase [Nitrososphaerota archaeon]|jgi:DNA primase|nr:DNA primase [Nitrososphaerota archaeon]MDG6936790.1 DNA primase [Nitrososphaerota archaeon]MDG6943646.1 DNA primase [Nitrososphaerota archaeon]